MRTQTLRLTVGSYSDGHWHVATIADFYERGILMHSEILSLAHANTEEQMRRLVDQAVDRIVASERGRTEKAAAADTQTRNAAAV